MFCYLMLIFLLFMGGHFELSQDGHPNRKNMRNIIPGEKNSKKVPHPEWVWMHGIVYFVGNPRYFLRRNYLENQLSYVRSGASMKQEGALALATLALLCFFCIFYTIGLMRSEMWEKNAVCPQNQPLLDYCIIMTCYGGIACLVCWISCVRGAPRTKTQWSLLYFIAFGEFVTNCVGMVFVLNAVKGLCSESAPVRFTMAATAVFIWGWFTMLMFIGLIMYCRKKMDVYRQKRRKIEKEEEARRQQRLGTPVKGNNINNSNNNNEEEEDDDLALLKED